MITRRTERMRGNQDTYKLILRITKTTRSNVDDPSATHSGYYICCLLYTSLLEKQTSSKTSLCIKESVLEEVCFSSKPNIQDELP